eukprot:6123901-Alexandrium_andersonii.AAC.1
MHVCLRTISGAGVPSGVRAQTLCSTACGLPPGLVNLPAFWAPVRRLPGWGQPRAPVQPSA